MLVEPINDITPNTISAVSPHLVPNTPLTIEQRSDSNDEIDFVPEGDWKQTP